MKYSELNFQSKDEMVNKILEFINKEIEAFERDKKQIKEKYRDVELTEKNQELRINATLSTLKSIKLYIEEEKNANK